MVGQMMRMINLGNQIVHVEHDGSMYIEVDSAGHRRRYGSIEICKNCGKEYFRTDTDKQKGVRIFCSAKCANEAWSKSWADKLNQELQVTKYVLLDGQKIYQGEDGKRFIVVRRKRKVGYRIRKDYGEIKRCKGCGKEFFSLFRYREGHPYGGQYCSKACFMKFGHSTSEHHNWKGGRKNARGYVFIFSPDHPRANEQKYVFEHHLVMEKKIGRYLRDDEIVHHIDGSRSNNDIGNLILFTDAQHKGFHGRCSEYAYEFVKEKAPRLVDTYLEFIQVKADRIRRGDVNETR